jgi:hypothetical protein
MLFKVPDSHNIHDTAQLHVLTLVLQFGETYLFTQHVMETNVSNDKMEW